MTWNCLIFSQLILMLLRDTSSTEGDILEFIKKIYHIVGVGIGRGDGYLIHGDFVIIIFTEKNGIYNKGFGF